MTDLICRNTMMRCQTPGMCSPHGGCQDPVNAQLRAVNFDYQLGADAAKNEIAQLKAENARLADQVAVLQAHPESWQSGYDEGRRMGTKTALSERSQLKAECEGLRRRAEFWRSTDEMPEAGTPVVVLRDAQFVGNPAHPGSRSGRWLELSVSIGRMFACDAISTGSVIGWVPVTEFTTIAELRKDAPSAEIIWCACGDGYPANSYGAGFMAANGGACENYDAAQPKISCPLELFEGLRDSAAEEAAQHRQSMGSYRPHRQELLDAVVRQCDELITGASKEASNG